VNDRSVGNNFEEEREDDAVNYCRKFWIQQSNVYESRSRKRMRGRSWPTNIFSQGRTYEEHDGLDHNLCGVKLKILGFQRKSYT
jgi:hypothetical protein